MTSRVRVRRVTADDRNAVRLLRIESLRESPEAFDSLHSEALTRTDEWWSAWMSSSEMFIACDDIGDIGIVRVQPLEEHPDDIAMVYSMWVHPRARGVGAGEALLNECIQWARNVGFAEVHLAVVGTNEHAVRLYERFGFRATGRVETRERDGARVLEMARVIAPV